MLRLVTLGRFALGRGDPPLEPLPLQPKRLGILAYLALAPDPGVVRRDILLALFWPERGHAAARHALRHALYYLRNALGDGIVVSRGGEEVGLVPDRLWCDAVMLEAALGECRPADALGLYRGDFLDGVFISGVSAEWEEWVSRTRERLRARATDAAWAVAEAAERSGDVAHSLAAARRACALEPDDEGGLRRLMCLLDGFGRRAGALQAYDTFARRIRYEYQARPSRETQALAERLRRSDAPSELDPLARLVAMCQGLLPALDHASRQLRDAMGSEAR